MPHLLKGASATLIFISNIHDKIDLEFDDIKGKILIF